MSYYQYLIVNRYKITSTNIEYLISHELELDYELMSSEDKLKITTMLALMA